MVPPLSPCTLSQVTPASRKEQNFWLQYWLWEGLPMTCVWAHRKPDFSFRGTGARFCTAVSSRYSADKAGLYQPQNCPSCPWGGCWASALTHRSLLLAALGLSCCHTAHVRLMTKGQALSETFLHFPGDKCKGLLLLTLCVLLFKSSYVLVTCKPLFSFVLAMGLCLNPICLIFLSSASPLNHYKSFHSCHDPTAGVFPSCPCLASLCLQQDWSIVTSQHLKSVLRKLSYTQHSFFCHSSVIGG